MVDSIFYRACKAAQLGVMVGVSFISSNLVTLKLIKKKFSVVGPSWHSENTLDYTPFRIFSLILMASRFVLALQYLSTLWFVRAYRQYYLPLALTSSIHFIAGVIFLRLHYMFPDNPGQTTIAYMVWYIVSILETIGILTISSIWRVITFDGTHMVQRMSLLTLIILGEGIIIISKALSSLVKSVYEISPGMIGQIIAAVMIVVRF